MIGPPSTLSFDTARIGALLEALERLASGDTGTKLEISPRHDALDAIAFGITVLADELRWAHARISESERLKADELHERALRRSAANFATAFHSNPCAMTVVRLSDGRFQDVNASFERQTGYARTDVIDRTAVDCGIWIDPDDLAALRREMQSGGRVSSQEVRFRTRTGALAIAVYSADIIMFGGDSCVLAAGLDVTDRKNTELQAAALRDELAHRGRVTMLEALTGSLAHEINQPLTAVMANAEAALRFLSPLRYPDLQEALVEIVSDTKRAGDVVGRMRALLKKSTTTYESVEVNGSVSEVVKLVQGNAIARQIVLEIDLGADIGPVLADRIQIQQVVLNLLLNAFDAVQKGDATARWVGVRTTCRDRSAVVEISDRGAGLSDEALAVIFEPFVTTKRDGMGLGLSICRAIAGAHGGFLDAARNPGAGMTFRAGFPLCPALEPDGLESLDRVRLQASR